MIDFTNEIYTAVADAADAAISGIICTSGNVPGSERFPVLLFHPIDSYADERSSESGDVEHRTTWVFEAQSYSNKSDRQAREIIALVDSLMTSWGWMRTTMAPVDDADDTVRRMVARWRGTVDADGRVGR